MVQAPPTEQAGLIFHSDRGSQYASEDFRDALADYGITASMSRRGDCCGRRQLSWPPDDNYLGRWRRGKFLMVRVFLLSFP